VTAELHIVVSNSRPNLQLDYSASILAVLKRFCYDIDAFNGPKVHSLTNVITMEKNIHDLFDRLQLYFELEATSSLASVFSIMALIGYRVAIEREGSLRSQTIHSTPHSEYVSFRHPEHLPVPAPELLALHTTCCKVAHLSGAAEYIDRVYRDAERMGVLASDGTSGDTLSYALLSMSNHRVRVWG
jgi:hypothetical protein